MENAPHPYWAKEAMRFPGNSDKDVLGCYHHALENCVCNDFAIRTVGNSVEWYSPILPSLEQFLKSQSVGAS